MTVADAVLNDETQVAVTEPRTITVSPLALRNLEIQEKYIKVNDQPEQVFRILVIDSPEKWLAAKDYCPEVFTFKAPNSNQIKRIKVAPLSTFQWFEMERDVEQHKALPEEDEVTTASKQALINLHRRLYVIEKATGMKIPGANFAEQIEWLKVRGSGEIDAIYDYVSNVMCSIQASPELAEYQTLLSKTNQTQETDIVSFDDWSAAADIETAFRWYHRFENLIIEFPLRGVCAKDKENIDANCQDATPPLAPARDPKTNKIIMGAKMVSDYEDAGYKKRQQAVAVRRLAMTIQAALRFDIPGETIEQKQDWLMQRPIGEVANLRNFIDGRLMSYGREYDFFG